MAKYFECPICIDQDKKWEELYEDEVDLRQHIAGIHTRMELVEYIMEREHPYDIDDEENLTRRKIVKSSVRKRKEDRMVGYECDLVPEGLYNKLIYPSRNSSIDDIPPSGSVSEETIRRVVRDEMHKVLRREHSQK
jgi:hypothetical protein